MVGSCLDLTGIPIMRKPAADRWGVEANIKEQQDTWKREATD